MTVAAVCSKATPGSIMILRKLADVCVSSDHAACNRNSTPSDVVLDAASKV